MNLSKGLYITIGSVSLVLGSIGLALPILPTTPFFLLSAFCFGKGSTRLSDWFKNSWLRKKSLMDTKSKAKILVPVSIIIAISAFLSRNNPLILSILAIVWICHMVYFLLIKK